MSTAMRRTLTGAQMSAILAAIRAVDEPAVLLPTVLAHVYDALLRGDGRRLADLKTGGGRISPDDWQIPTIQWDAIAQAARDRAQRWGIGPQLRADLLDRMPGCLDDPAATGIESPEARQGRGLRLLCVSVRGNHGYLAGNRNVHPFDLDEPNAVPAGIGTRFASLDEIKRYVATELRGLDVFWQVRVIDDDGAVVMYGFRAGPGERLTWRPPSPPAESAVTRSTAGA